MRILTLLTFIYLSAFTQIAAGSGFTPSPVPGGVAAISLGSVETVKPAVRFGSKRVMVVNLDDQWTALVGLPLTILPGSKIISVQQPGKNDEKMVSFQVKPKTYPEQRITLKEKKYVTPDKEQLARINREASHIREQFSVWRDTPTVPLLFDWPVEGRLSSPFGLKRFFNDKPRKPHSGIDIAASEGTDILMPLPGEVLDTGNYYFNGNTVFVDHGQGMISMFCHMSKISVKKGESLARGQKVGEVGMTGRVTGPHLHWSLSLNQNRVDPMLFLPERKTAEKAASN
jgi:murein DD-endopeptidase MepM/ murein hydrolase activator NlpD